MSETSRKWRIIRVY